MRETPNHASLEASYRERSHDWPESMKIRIHRAISWIGQAEKCDDDDTRFIFLWIAFNAAYAEKRTYREWLEKSDENKQNFREQEVFLSYFEKLIALEKDNGGRIYAALWNNFSDYIRNMMNNRYIFDPFWKYHNGFRGYDDWEGNFEKQLRDFKRFFSKKNSGKLLSMMFGRLYVLRNQMMHGGATWGSKFNRTQVRDGVAILAFLVPVFVDIMMESPDEDWGEPPFSPSVDLAEDRLKHHFPREEK